MTYSTDRLRTVLDRHAEASHAFPALTITIDELAPIRFAFSVAGVHMSVTGWLGGEAAGLGAGEKWQPASAKVQPTAVEAIEHALVDQFGEHVDELLWLARFIDERMNGRPDTVEIPAPASTNMFRSKLGDLFFVNSYGQTYRVHTGDGEWSFEGPVAAPAHLTMIEAPSGSKMARIARKGDELFSRPTTADPFRIVGFYSDRGAGDQILYYSNQSLVYLIDQVGTHATYEGPIDTRLPANVILLDIDSVPSFRAVARQIEGAEHSDADILDPSE